MTLERSFGPANLNRVFTEFWEGLYSLEYGMHRGAQTRLLRRRVTDVVVCASIHTFYKLNRQSLRICGKAAENGGL